MPDLSKKDPLYELVRANPLISRQAPLRSLRPVRSPVPGHVACIGAANLDRKLRALATLTMGTSNPARQGESFGGVARNIAENLARLGVSVRLTTAIGDDASGRALLAHAEAAGIDTRASLKLDDACSGTYTAVLDEHGEMVLALADMALYEQITPGFLASRQPRHGAAALTVADLNLPRATLAMLLADAQRVAAPLVMVAVSQPKMAHLPVDLRGLRLLILNQGELEIRVGAPLLTDADFAAACACVRQQGARDVIVTRGAAGVLYTCGDGQVGHLPAAAVADLVDVTGAGDAFAAAVCWSLYHGSDDLELACRRGMMLAAITLGCAETVCPWLDAGSLDAIDRTFNPLHQE